jgi:PAS domain S-box-containing protein
MTSSESGMMPERLRETEAQLRLAAIVETSDDAIISKSLDGIIKSWNAAAQRIFGWSADEVIGKPITVIIPTDRLQEEPRILERLRAGERVDHFDTVRVTKDGRQINVSVTISPIRDSSGHIVGASKIARDTTIVKEYERVRNELLERERAARIEAERSNHMKDDFLATLSHELRTPLNAILGYTQLLRKGKASQEEALSFLEIIERNARSQTQIIEDLLDLSRIISGKIRLDVQRVDLATVVASAIEAVRPLSQAKKQQLTAVLDPLGGLVRGDPSRLQQVIWNLLSNAIKFTATGGKVQVALERVNSHVEIIVSDTGAGINPDFLPHLFERFRQENASSSRRHGGLGIGLAIVKELVELHGGTIRAKSPGPGRGSTFIVGLPLSVMHEDIEPGVTQRHPKTPSLTSENSDDIDLSGIRVLVVDDEPDARQLIARILESCGAEVHIAASLPEALAQMKQHIPHALISDLGLPDNDGFDLIRSIRALDPDKGGKVPAAALSAFARAEDRRRAIIAGFRTHIAKPVEPAELIAVVASLAGRLG